MRTWQFLLILLPIISACSSTLHYQATGFYAVDAASGEAVSCSGTTTEGCKQIKLTWETERYCGIYKKAPDSLSDEQLRVGSSPTTVDDWAEHDNNTVFQGDDEFYEVVVGEEVLIASDPLCGQFEPPVNLVGVRAGEELILEIYCRPIVHGIQLMPPSENGYRLNVEVVEKEKSWLGCRK